MDAPIEVLRIEHNVVSKELARFRACDNETRCYFCREWAQYIYKKHFVWNAKTQEEVTVTHFDTIAAGRYQINLMLPDAGPVKQKQRSAKMFDEFRKLLETKQDDKGSLTEELIAACQLWMTLPSNLSGLPESFEQVQFNPYPDAIPLVEDPKEPSQLLDPLIIERQALCLPSEGFHLLKNLTGDILLSHSQPTCDHIRPESKTPVELDIERDIVNEKMEQAIKKALVELEQALDHSWRHLNGFMDQVLALEAERSVLMGDQCQEAVDAFVEKQGLVPFKDYWTDLAANFKKKKGGADLEKVDRAFADYFDRLTTCAQEFQQVFVTQRLEAVRALVQKLWDLVVPTIQQMADRMACHEQEDERYLANCKAVSASLKDLHPTNDVAFAAETIQLETSVRVAAFLEEIQALKKAYTDESRPNVAGRLDKVINKDFKKRLKKIEGEYYSMRQGFRYQLTKKIFPEELFCKFSLVCIEALMQEGEVMEAVTIEKEVKRFLDSHQDLIEEREFLLEDFEEGVQTGRRELAGVLGKLFLKEGMRIQGENLAVKRQNMLLKSMGMPVEEQAEPKKKKNKKKKANGATSSTASSVQPSPSASTVVEPKPSAEKQKQASKEKKSAKTKVLEPEKVLSKLTQPEEGQKAIKLASKTVEKEKKKPISPSVTKKPEQKLAAAPKKVEVSKSAKIQPAPAPFPPKVEPVEVKPIKTPTPAKVNQGTTYEAPLASKSTKPVKVQSSPKPVSAATQPKETKVPTKPKPTAAAIVASAATVSVPAKNVPKPEIREKKSVQDAKAKKVESEPFPALPSSTPAAIDTKTTETSVDNIGGWGSVDISDNQTGWGQSKSVEAVKTKKTASTGYAAAATKPPVQHQPSPAAEKEEEGWVQSNSAETVKAKTTTNTGYAAAATKPPVQRQPSPPVEEEGGWDQSKSVETATAKTTISAGYAAAATKPPTQRQPSPPVEEEGWGKSSSIPTESSNNLGGWGVPDTANTDGWGNTSNDEQKIANNWKNESSWGETKVKIDDGSSSEREKARSRQKLETNNWRQREQVEAEQQEVQSKKQPPRKSDTTDNWRQSAVPKQEPEASVKQEQTGWGSSKKQTPRKSDAENWRQSAASKSEDTIATTKWQQPKADGWGHETLAQASGESSFGQQQKQEKNQGWSQSGEGDGWKGSTRVEPNSDGWGPQMGGWTEHSGNDHPAADTNVQPPSSSPMESDKEGEVVNFSLKGLLKNTTPQPPGLSKDIIHPIPTGTNIPPPHVSVMPAVSQHEFPSSEKIRGMNQENLVMMVQNLHRENAQLIQTIMSTQQEMTMMTGRYSELMTLSREREAQTLQLFEARKQTEMEEARRYILSLEARINTLENQLKSTGKPGGGITAGFGNQDLFAGYREEMQSNHHRGKRMWKKQVVVRCGNCGGSGHTSAECQDVCRYCGSVDHLSEACEQAN
ncbi:hypothetical protein DFQ28_002677 [Apophysomyces sp. BC1034]|nr:hypothetical protein DFQ30_002553 [Apophysomyces sp. BC1015]KAG0176454.1 hypothetical protein DFQ29_006098 [Apophysomyces sp. BC1021]KAG0189952.1 hypothetical protein DFQ28_002677 [Apophysomyces sp. BC1034]